MFYSPSHQFVKNFFVSHNQSVELIVVYGISGLVLPSTNERNLRSRQRVFSLWTTSFRPDLVSSSFDQSSTTYLLKRVCIGHDASDNCVCGVLYETTKLYWMTQHFRRPSFLICFAPNSNLCLQIHLVFSLLLIAANKISSIE